MVGKSSLKCMCGRFLHTKSVCSRVTSRATCGFFVILFAIMLFLFRLPSNAQSIAQRFGLSRILFIFFFLGTHFTPQNCDHDTDDDDAFGAHTALHERTPACGVTCDHNHGRSWNQWTGNAFAFHRGTWCGQWFCHSDQWLSIGLQGQAFRSYTHTSSVRMVVYQ